MNQINDSGVQSACKDSIIQLVEKQLNAEMPDLASVSIGLGIIEAALTNKNAQAWPASYQVTSAFPTIQKQVYMMLLIETQQ